MGAGGTFAHLPLFIYEPRMRAETCRLCPEINHLNKDKCCGSICLGIIGSDSVI
jgi:hypothetical protein